MENADLIESVLTSGEAFVVPPSRRSSRIIEASPELLNLSTSEPSAEEDSAPPPPAPESAGDTNSDSWRQEYESQVQAWRAQSAEARDKAEKERARWEAVRAEQAEKRKSAGILEIPAEIPTGVPNIHALPTPSSPEALMASVAAVTAVEEPTSRAETTDGGSQKWEDVQASTSSFPSSFPERTQPPSPTPQVPALSSTKPTTNSPTATLTIFDSTLSTKTRVLALLSSLAINLALPFVNGVMLGFGEIFAKNIVLQWFGWKAPGSLAGTAGLRSTRGRSSPFR